MICWMLKKKKKLIYKVLYFEVRYGLFWFCFSDWIKENKTLKDFWICFSDWVNENKTLQDEDHTKWKENGWKQLNMLKDYKIPNGADVVLTQYQKCRTLPRSPNGMILLFT